jgi:hypothetical protein
MPALTMRPSRFHPGTKHQFAALTRSEGHQAMLTALIILSLISLLVATEAEPTSSPAEELRGELPLRPGKKGPRGDQGPKSDRIAA